MLCTLYCGGVTMSSDSFLELSKQAIARNSDSSVTDVSAVLFYPTPTGYFGLLTADGGSNLYTVKYANDDRRFTIARYAYETSIEF